MRVFAVLLCAFTLLAFARDVVGPTTAADIGADWTSNYRITAVEPASPAARAGLRAGDLIRLDLMSPLQRVALAQFVPGRPSTMAVERGNRVVNVTVVARPASYWNAQMGIGWALALLYAGIALLVAFRAPRGRQRAVILAMLFGLSIAWALDIVYAIPTLEARLAAQIVADLTIAVFLIGAYLFVLWFPQRTTRATKWLWGIGLPVSIGAAALFVAADIGVQLLHVLPAGTQPASYVFALLAGAATIAGVIDGARAAAPELRTATIVAGSTLIILALVNVLYASTNLLGIHLPWFYYIALLRWTSGFGVAYAVLRHRLLDLNFVISRAAVFSVVSLLLLGAFALAEWVFATALERSLGPAFNEGGKTALAACVALLLGLSAGSVHRIVEHRLNRVFFARRYRALADLHRFALETDAVMDSNALLTLALGALRRNLDAQFVALYTGRPETGYVAVGMTAASELPLHLDQNEEVVLRMRRWGEAFVVDNNAAHPLAHAFIAPMTLRNTLYGFAICGPKTDRTAYLPDECETVAALVHRVGIAFEWLTRSTPALDKR